MPDRSVVYRLRADVSQLKAQMAVASASVKGAADKMTAATKSGDQFRKGLSTLGLAAGKVGLVAAVGLGAAVLKAANFDQAMSKVAAATHASASNMELLRAAALKAGAQTVFSATESADAITAMSKAGVSAKDILAGGLTGALSLASAGELDVAQAADIAATAMNQFGLGGKDVGHIADVLAAAAGKAQGEVTDMSAALKFVGPVAHQMGISLEETTGTIAELATQGILGEQAGTGLRGMLLSLSSPSALAAKEMKKLGINVYDAQGQFVGFNGVAEQMHSAMSGLTAAERDQAFGRIFGNAQVTTARILYQGGAAAVDKWTDSVNDSGFAAETAKTKLDNLKGDLEQLGGSLETALIGTGSSSQGPLRGLVQGLTDVVNAYNKLPAASQSAVGATLGVTAALGGGIFIFSKVVQGIASTREAMSQLGVSASRTGSLLRTSLNVGAVLVGLQLLDDALDAAFDKNLDTSKLGRSLDALAAGAATGELTDKFGKNLDDFSVQLAQATGNTDALSRSMLKIPLVGGFLSGNFLPHDVETGVQNIKALDEALAGMVESGRQAEAAAVFDVLSEKARKAGISTADLNKGFEQYQIAVDNASPATNVIANLLTTAASATGLLAGGTKGAAAGTKQLAGAAAQSAATLKASRTAAAETAQSFLNLSKNAANAKVSLSSWLRQLASQADALRNFTNNATIAANKGLRDGLIKQLQKMGPEGALRMRQLANASQKDIGRANKAWGSWARTSRDATNAVGGGVDSAKARIALMRAEIGRLKSKTVHMDEKGAPAARARIAALRAEIDRLHNKDVTITTHHRNFGGPNIVADGGTIMNFGGTVPGQREPYGDKVYAFLAPGEEVISNRYGQADRFRADRSSGRIPHYADGGTVQRLADGGGVASDGRAHETLRERIRRLTRQVELATKAIDKERTSRDDLVSKRNELASSVSGHFTSDLFASQPDNLSWMNPAQRQAALTGGVFATLKSDIASANTFKATLASLKKRGLDGQALASLASSGDVGRAQAFSNLSSADLSQFKTLFNQRAAAASGVGAFAGSAVFAGQITAQTKALQTMVAQNAALAAQLKKLEHKKPAKITVHEAHNGKHTAKEVSRRQALG